MNRRPRWVTALGLAIFVAVVSAPLWVSDRASALLVDIAVLVTLTALWAALASDGRLVMAGMSGLFGTGAYALLFLTERVGLNPVLAAAGAGVVGLGLAMMSAPMLLRVSPALAMLASLLVATLLATLVARVPTLGGPGSAEITASADLGGLADSIVTWLAIVTGVGSVSALTFYRRSRLGLALAADRDDRDAARALGLPVVRGRLLVLSIAGFGVALAGAVVHLRDGSVAPDEAFDLVRWTLVPAALASIGGLRTIEGPVLAAVVYVLVDRLVDGSDLSLHLGLGVLALIVLLVADTRGLWGMVLERVGIDPFQLRRQFAKRSARS